MHRPSTPQAELDARVLRERRIGQRLIDPPDSYTALGRRPGRALLGGLVVSLVVAMVVAVISVAGAARAAKQRQDQAATVVTETTVPATTAPAGDGDVLTSISVGPEAAVCEASQEEIAIVPLFTQKGLLDRVEVAGLAEECVGLQMRLAVLGLNGAEVASRELVVEQAGSLSFDGLGQEFLVREEIGEVSVEVR
jgi:hypothetical protein